jgi:hypothetical protein
MKRSDKIINYKHGARRVKAKRRRVKARKPVEIKEVSNLNLNVPDDFNYVIYLDKTVGYSNRLAATTAIRDFSNHGFCGKWNFTYSVNKYRRGVKIMDRLYLQDESDLVMLRLCHNIAVDRIHNIIR